jgi:hypothetical protein
MKRVPWREISMLHPGILKGSFLHTEIASDVATVQLGNVSRKDQDVETFFQRTSFLVQLPLRPAPKIEPAATAAAQTESRLGADLAPSGHQVEILRKCLDDSSLLDLMKVAGRSDRTKFRHQVLRPLIDEGLIELTIPDKPTSRLQKYRLTGKGRAWITTALAHKPVQP